MLTIDWHTLFIPHGSILEVIIRGTVMYLFMFALLRLLPRRQIGALGVADLLIIVLIADAAQNGMAGEYRSITEGAVLVATIVLLDLLIDWIDYRFPKLQLSSGKPVVLVRGGKILAKNLERQKMKEDELMTQLREQGIKDVEAVKLAQLEGDGKLSVITFTPRLRKTPRAQMKGEGA